MVDNTYRVKLVEYLKKNLKKSYPVDTLRIALINQGYLRSTIDEALKEAMNELAKEAPTMKEKPQIEHEVVKVVPDEMPVLEKESLWWKIKGLFRKKK
ncbi:MAG: hypothetical protein AABW47_05025 [Nanoarchaeota archaeon]